VYLARHGQTAYNAERRFQGQLPVALDEVGRAQAQQLAQRVADQHFAALWCSPLARARETAEVLAPRLGLSPREDARLMETDAGDWTNRSFAEIQAEHPEGFQAFIGGHPDFAFPGGESFAQQGVRVAAVLADVEAGDLPALVVCHGGVIRIALYQRSGAEAAMGARVPNTALIALDPPGAPNGVGGNLGVEQTLE
jgi:broad specificity phosphatase PhoE